MTNNRIWIMGGTIAILAILVLAGLLGVKPQLDAAQASDVDRSDVEALNAQKAIELVSMKADFERLGEVAAQVAEVRKSVPASPDLDTFIGQLSALQAANGVTVMSYTPQAPLVFTPTVSSAPNVPSTIDATRFVTIPMTIVISGERQASLNFIAGLQSGERLILVSSVSLATAPDGTSTTTITGLAYVLLEDAIVDPAAEAAALAAEAVAAE